MRTLRGIVGENSNFLGIDTVYWRFDIENFKNETIDSIIETVDSVGSLGFKFASL